jgi:HEAT repeat protein
MDELAKLQSPDVNQRVSAAETLSQMGAEAGPAAVELVKACGDDRRVCEHAVAALEQLGAPPPEALEPLAQRINASSPLEAYWAVTLLGRSGSAAKFCQDQLAEAVESSVESSVQERAVWALGKIGADSDRAINSLKNASRSSNARLARLATASLDELGT